MRTVEHICEFLDTFVAWASVQAMALVGSYARGAAKDDSDIDLVILMDRPQTYLENVKWAERFGGIEKHQREDYGKLISLRIWYQAGEKVEYSVNVSAPQNQSMPLVQAGVQRDYFIKAILGAACAKAVACHNIRC